VYEYSTDMEFVTDTVQYSKNEIINSFNSFEPRFSIRFLLTDSKSIKWSYARSSQYFHLIGNSSFGLPTDLWASADSHVKPQFSNIYSLGYFQNLQENAYEFSVETYFKQMDNVIDFKDNADLLLNPNIETQVLPGYGRAYGIELSIKKTTGNVTGWINYTLSKNERKIEGINEGNFFPTRFDKRHNLNVTLFYEINKNWSLSSNLKLSSGGYITMPIGVYQYYNVVVNYYSARNGFELPMYHRLDFSAVYRSSRSLSRKYKGEWTFSVLNAYNKKNIFTLFVRHNQFLYNQVEIQKMYLFGVMPSVSYNFKF